jgi:hypothetical protein
MWCDAENDESAESYEVPLVARHSSNLQGSLRVYHSNTAVFSWCGAEATRADKVGQLACLPEFVQIQEIPEFL